MAECVCDFLGERGDLVGTLPEGLVSRLGEGDLGDGDLGLERRTLSCLDPFFFQLDCGLSGSEAVLGPALDAAWGLRLWQDRHCCGCMKTANWVGDWACGCGTCSLGDLGSDERFGH